MPRQGGLDALIGDLRAGQRCVDKDGPAIIGAEFAQPVRRGGAVLQTWMVIFDVDGAEPRQLTELVNRITELRLEAVLYASPSDGLKDPELVRCRVILPLAKPCPRDLHRHLARRLETDLEVPASDSAAAGDCVRLWYGLRAPTPGRRRWLRVVDGAPLAITSLLRNIEAEIGRQEEEARRVAQRTAVQLLPNSPHRLKRETAYRWTALKRACERISNATPGQRHALLVKEATALHKLAGPDIPASSIDEALATIAQSVLPANRQHEIPAILKWAREKAAGSPRQVPHGR